MNPIPDDQVDRLYARLDDEAERGGYHLNPNREFTRELIRGLLVNEERYGYWACPCRLADGEKAKDLDIICPCDYRDPDLSQFGTCFCGLYVSQEVKDGKRKFARIPERRPVERMMEEPAGPPSSGQPQAGAASAQSQSSTPSQTSQTPPPAPGLPNPTGLSYPVWRCRVCGYLCARGEPPETCPVCRARKERFERFL